IGLFRQLAECLAALDRPVTAQAVLHVEDLLTSSDSPLYARERASGLRLSLRKCLHALDASALCSPAESTPASRQSVSGASRQPRRPLPGETTRAAQATLCPVQSPHRRVAISQRRSHR